MTSISVPLEAYLSVAALLFCIGIWGLINSRNAVRVLMSIERVNRREALGCQVVEERPISHGFPVIMPTVINHQEHQEHSNFRFQERIAS